MDTAPTPTSCGPYSESALDNLDYKTLIPAPDGRLKHLLDSNEAPLHNEENIIRGQLAQGEGILARYNASIDCLERDLTLLRGQRDHEENTRHEQATQEDVILPAYETGVDCLQREMTRLRGQRNDLEVLIAARNSILASIRRLPSELIAEIAYHTLGLEDEITLNVREGPWALSLVCRRWRDAVVSRRALWSQIRLSSEHMNTISPIILDTILTRAKDFWLEFNIDFDGRSSFRFATEGTDVHKKLLEMMVSRSHLWQKVTFFEIPTDLIPVLDPVRHCLPLLKDLFIAFPENSDHDVTLTMPLDHFADAPLLVHVELHDFPGDMHLLQLPWSQLKHLESYGCRVDEVISSLSQLRNLEFCSIRADSRSIPDNLPEFIELPSLRRLSTDSGGILGLLLAPSLVAVETVIRARNVVSFMSIISRSSCTLTYLSISRIETDIDSMMSVLQAVPSLSTLRIYESTYSHSLISGLTLIPDQPCTLPILETLSMEIDCESTPMEDTFDIDLLAQMVQSRQKLQTTRLRQFNFEIDLDTQVDITIVGALESFDTLREDGMEISIDLSSDLESEEFAIENWTYF